jgi:hypothetical protein
MTVTYDGEGGACVVCRRPSWTRFSSTSAHPCCVVNGDGCAACLIAESARIRFEAQLAAEAREVIAEPERFTLTEMVEHMTETWGPEAIITVHDHPSGWLVTAHLDPIGCVDARGVKRPT